MAVNKNPRIYRELTKQKNTVEIDDMDLGVYFTTSWLLEKILFRNIEHILCLGMD